MPTLWFVVPAHGRAQLAQVCLRQLRRTCDALTDHGIEASAVVVADDENLATAEALGFARVRRDNRFLSRKFNDGIQLALDETVNPRPADYVVPIGSDDWIDWRILTRLPNRDTVVGFQRMSFVREDGRELRPAHVRYQGGCGMRIYPRRLLELLDYRPADEDRERGCDTSILVNLRRAYDSHHHRELRVVHYETNPLQIVDFKSPGEQINAYEGVTAMWGRGDPADPFEALQGVYPDEALDEMAAFYSRDRQAVAA